MHRGDSDARYGRVLGRHHECPPKYTNPGKGRAWRKRKLARTVRREFSRLDHLDAAAEAADDAAAERAEEVKAAEGAAAWAEYEWEMSVARYEAWEYDLDPYDDDFYDDPYDPDAQKERRQRRFHQKYHRD